MEQQKLEVEVGPLKYIAEFIYGQEADKNLLEEAVALGYHYNYICI